MRLTLDLLRAGKDCPDSARCVALMRMTGSWAGTARMLPHPPPDPPSPCPACWAVAGMVPGNQ